VTASPPEPGNARSPHVLPPSVRLPVDRGRGTGAYCGARVLGQ
jgi:hypothetical protein